VLGAFRPGRASWLRSILTRRIDRILFAATKADHVHHSDHDRLARLLGSLVRRATERAAFVGAEVLILPLAAVRATREVSIKREGDRLPGITGVPLAGERMGDVTYDGETEIALFPGDLPKDPESSRSSRSTREAMNIASPRRWRPSSFCGSGHRGSSAPKRG
jgi:predicted YcjX-like family ATPase